MVMSSVQTSVENSKDSACNMKKSMQQWFMADCLGHEIFRFGSRKTDAGTTPVSRQNLIPEFGFFEIRTMALKTNKNREET